MRMLFVTWWPRDHFEFDWHLSPDELSGLESKGIAVIRLAGDAMHAPATLLRLLRRGRFLWEVLRQGRRADLIVAYMDSPSTRLVGVCRRLGLLGSAKVIVTDFWLKPPVGTGLSALLKQLFLRHVYGSVDAVFFDTRPGLDLYRSHGLLGNRPKLMFMPSCAMESKNRFLAQLSEGLSSEPKAREEYFFAIGKSHRDFDTVFRAASRLPDTTFVVMTTNELPTSVPRNVTLAPWGSYSEYIAMLRDAQAVIVPLLPGEEAAGIRSIYEAWCLGIPTVVAASDGIRDYLETFGVTALSYEPGNAESLCSVLEIVSTEQELAARSVREAKTAVSAGELSSRAYMRRFWIAIDELSGGRSTSEPRAVAGRAGGLRL